MGTHQASHSASVGHAQGVKHFKDIRYSDNVTYGELFMQVCTRRALDLCMF